MLGELLDTPSNSPRHTIPRFDHHDMWLLQLSSDNRCGAMWWLRFRQKYQFIPFLANLHSGNQNNTRIPPKPSIT
ncbi:Uncharacterized protein HZ326_24548 [Fusarium oxysporum f. sp. albedinis]|nr:Uncharacterized protein HZ326_24548 [Fusarium oxysporum f. sp. albedinis]